MSKFTKPLFLAVLACSFTLTHAQDWTKNLDKQHLNFKDAQTAFRAAHPNQKADETRDDEFMNFKRWEWFWQPRVSAAGEFPKSTVLWDNWSAYVKSHGRSMALNTASSGNWSFVGPSTTPGGYTGLGRVSCMAFHPTDPLTFWVGTPAGGIWKTIDGGSNWSTSTTVDHLPVLGVSDIAVDPTNPNNMFIATGDGDLGSLWAIQNNYAGDTKTVGVLKSTDAGSTWNATGLSFQVTASQEVRKVVLVPTAPNTLIAASSSGIYRTTDGGATWNQTMTGYFMDMVLCPGSPGIVYASTKGSSAQIWVSTDTAKTFTQATSLSGIGRIALAVSPVCPALVEGLCSNASGHGFGGIIASRDKGATFQTLYASGALNLLSSNYDGSGSTGQGGYDLAFGISPADTSTLFVGGVNTWASTDAGHTWTLNTMWASGSNNPGNVVVVHADKHCIAFHPLVAGTLFQTNDGGIYKTTDGGTTYTDLSNGLQISQMYRIAVAQSDATINLCGLQDNGSRKDAAGTWSYATGGDGTSCAIDPLNAQNMIASYVQGKFYASTDGFATSNTVSDNITGTPTGSWVTPVVMNPLKATTLYAGYADMYRSYDFGTTWTTISSNLTGGSSNTLNWVAVAPSDTNVIYAGTFDSVYVTTNGGANWASISNFSLGNSKSNICVDPANAQHVWVSISTYTTGEKVYESTNAGSTWTNFSGTLPNIPINCLVHETGGNNGIYAGTDAGVYYINSLLPDWILYSTGLPNVVVADLQIQTSSGKLRAGTFGRGLWESDLYSGPTSVQPVVKTKPTQISLYPNPGKGLINIQLGNFKSADKANIYNYLGETLKTIDIRTPLQQIDISSFADGIYYISFESEHYSQMHKVVKLN
ncbi:MAG: T9SS type A sorting domain-containing protein [Bacteroidia bacterium]